MISFKDVHDLETLLMYCSENLNWAIDEEYFDNVEDLTFEYSPDELGLNPDECASIRSVKQLRPLYGKQPWGIFAVDFDCKYMDITSMRKILHSLIPHRGTNDEKIWQSDHLLFLCFWGENSSRTVGFVAFEKQVVGLPTLKAIYCTPKIEDRSHIADITFRLQKLTWPIAPIDSEKWVSEWHSAFTTAKGQTIKDTRLLAEKMAELALGIATTIDKLFFIETESGSMHILFNRFSQALSIELSKKEFADMYAQTIVYGLFSARCMDTEHPVFDPQTAIESVPNTNPLIKELLFECCSQSGAMYFDELDTAELIDLLNRTDVPAILADFNRQTGYGKEDPVVFFYEKFLDIYEKEQKKRRGVYYTPVPVVDFMVRSVTELLKKNYGCQEGLLNEKISILDPATGTGTFLRRIIYEVYDEFEHSYFGKKSEMSSQWTKYAENHLLNRLYGFEFMMAPYAVAHMKIAMALKDTGYSFPPNCRLQVFLANALTNSDNTPSPVNCDDPLFIESSYAAAVKKSEIDVVIGNPPYRTDSINKDPWILNLMEDYKKEPGTEDRLQERNPKVINDDYVKFTRFAQSIVSLRENAIVAYITPHSYTDNLTFRGMRWSLLQAFDSIYILDLHGNVMSREVSGTDERDENIFDIQQGVCISFFVKNSRCHSTTASVFHADVFGLRLRKYDFLRAGSIASIKWEKIVPAPPFFFFKYKDLSNQEQYDAGVKLSSLFPVSIGGVKTHNDATLVSPAAFSTGFDRLYDYRPFDVQHINYDLTKVERGRFEVMQHFLDHKNLGLVMNRQVVTDNWSHIQIAENMIDNRLHYSRKGIPVVCPAYLYEGEKKAPNVNYNEISKIATATGLRFAKDDTDDAREFDVIDLMDYAYAILNSTAYRLKYQPLLSIDFPRIPLPCNSEQFRLLVSEGAYLRQLHMCKLPTINSVGISFVGLGSGEVCSISYADGRVKINQTQYFDGVREDLWEYCFGGYHGLQKWFKDRRGTVLTEKDIAHVINVYNIFDITQEKAAEIDVLLEKFSLI